MPMMVLAKLLALIIAFVLNLALSCVATCISALVIVIGFRIFVRLKTELCNESQKSTPSRRQAIMITGATSGIGLSLSKYYHRLGYTIVAAYYSSEEPGYEELERLNLADKNSVFIVELNVRSLESIASSYDQVREFLDKSGYHLHALINNAGIVSKHPIFWDYKDSTTALVETNLLGPMRMIRQYTPLLAKTPGSRVINISSILSHLPLSAADVYCGTKAGLASFSLSIGKALEHLLKVKMVVIYPGNLMKNTAIMDMSVESLSQVSNVLTPEEKELYGSALEAHCQSQERFNSNLVKARESTSGRDDGLGRGKRKFSTWSLIKKNLVKIGIVLSGAVNTMKLENSEVMVAFDNAVRLRDPPLELYAGNKFFTIFVGAVFDVFGNKAKQLIANLIDGKKDETAKTFRFGWPMN